MITASPHIGKEWEIVYVDGIIGYYVIMIGDWEDVIDSNDSYDPFETEEEARDYAERNL